MPAFGQAVRRGPAPPHPGASHRTPLFFRAHLPDPYYSERPFAPQEESPVRRIRAIVHPTLGFPALAQCGGSLEIWVVAPKIASDKTSLRAKAWQVELRTDQSGGMVLRPRVVRVSREQELFRLRARLAPDSAADVYQLTVHGPKGLSDRQPRAVRILCPAPRHFTFALLSDHQLWDPSWKFSSGLKAAQGWPTWGQTDNNKRITLQEFHELELLDPAFVLYPGDLLFGLDYGKEYASMYDWWKNKRLATFMVPGNHDGYARYTIRLKGSLPQMAVAVVRCRKVWPKTRSWHKIFTYLSCVYGDIKEVLFSRLVQDGLVSFTRTFAPPYYSFDFGRYHFVALNTYDGTNKRRHALSLWVPFKGLKLGAPAVDNYGGYLSEKQLSWLEQDLKQAAAQGRTIVVLGHQDPRGNEQDRRYQANEPFPTSPLGLDGFDEWDYDAKWDSNPNDRRGEETPWNNSGVRLLKLLLRYASYYISGHVHEDETTVYHPGDVVIPGLRTRRSIAFVRVTTASAGIRHKGYWGYRLLHADDQGHIDVSPYDAELELDSVPAGNFWLQTAGSKTHPTWTLHSALPKPLRLTLRARLTYSPSPGYRFVVTDPSGRTRRLHLQSVSPDRNGTLATYRVALTTPTAAPGSHQARTEIIRALPAKGNQPPRIIVRLGTTTRLGKNRRNAPRIDRAIPAKPDVTLPVSLGRTATIDASASHDPEHRPLLAAFIRVDRLCPVTPHSTQARRNGETRAASSPRGVTATGGRGFRKCGQVLFRRSSQAAFTVDRLGLFQVTVTAFDDAGAQSVMSFLVRSRPADVAAPRPGCGCCALTTTPILGLGGLLSLLAFGLAFFGLLFFLRRRKKEGPPR